MNRDQAARRPTTLTNTPAWNALQQHYKSIAQQHMRQLFNADPQRFDRMHLICNDILFDYSKNIVDETTLPLLFNLARQADVSGWINRLFSGDKINHTEQRSVLHTALRNLNDSTLMVDAENLLAKVQHELARMETISDAIRSRRWLGCNQQPITDIVNIGIGGSDLGPKMVTEALRPYAAHDLRNHFVSNLDENHILDTLEYLKPETTLFIISSKSFSTIETLMNGQTARRWFQTTVKDPTQLRHHFLAVTTNQQAAVEFGIPAENILQIWDWVGGRYSLWSAIGLPIAIAIGMDNFRELLRGGFEADMHFCTTALEKNIPVIMALLGIWYNNFFGAKNYAILPYDEHMKSFSAYLQQADMESNGKSVDREGNPVGYSTGPVIFGEIGIKGQHAFYQLLHQGTQLIPADFLAPITDHKPIAEHHRALMANVFAQTEALMKGRTADEVMYEMKQQGLSKEQIDRLLPYRVFDGNRPSNTFLFQTLAPRTLGSLIAFYEHKIFVQGIIWNLNSFDQWGVELGKKLSKEIIDELHHDAPSTHHDASTNGLINYYKRKRPG
ncbi:MAG: glucose-6-phosphate isomerase [Gammaproteobacteria bacterium]|nr:glucose-6-phosphate isomerase [Gammaproteobacteria bacterium]